MSLFQLCDSGQVAEHLCALVSALVNRDANWACSGHHHRIEGRDAEGKCSAWAVAAPRGRCLWPSPCRHCHWSDLAKAEMGAKAPAGPPSGVPGTHLCHPTQRGWHCPGASPSSPSVLCILTQLSQCFIQSCIIQCCAHSRCPRMVSVEQRVRPFWVSGSTA